MRLVIEIGLDHGLFIPTKHVRMLMLTDWPEKSVVVEFIFYALVFLSIFENLFYFYCQMKQANVALQEELDATRYALRVKILSQVISGELRPQYPFGSAQLIDALGVACGALIWP